MEKIKNYLEEEYKNAGIEGLRTNTVLSAIKDTLAGIDKQQMFDKRINVNKNISVLKYKSGTIEVHISIEGVFSTYKTFKTELAKYIVLTKNKKEVRFFAIGYIDNNKTFTGIIHDYTGAGNYEERLVFKDEWITTEVDGEPLEWDTQVELFNSISQYTVEQIETTMDKYICFDTDLSNYVPQNGTMRYYNNNVLIDNMSLNVPYGLGNTSFIDGYEITENIVKIEETVEAIKTYKNKKVWSLFEHSFGEVNSYYLTLEQAMNMIAPAVEEDGFCKENLVIAIAKKSSTIGSEL